MPHPTEAQLRSIATELNRHYPNGWAITGSVALVLQAHVSHVSSGIFPADLDLIIDADDFASAVFHIAELLGTMITRNPPSPKSTHTKIWVGDLSIDLLSPKAGKGDLSNITRMNLNGVQINVVGLSKLKQLLQDRVGKGLGDKVIQAKGDIEIADRIRVART